MKIAICDDEISFQEILHKDLEKYYGALEIDTVIFDSGKQFLERFQKDPMEFQLIFMDIEMPELNGINVSKQIREVNESVPIIFLTSHTELAMDGYEVDAFRFLDKPLQFEKLSNALKAFDQLRLLDSKLELQDGEKICLVDWTDIEYIQSENVYIHVYVKDHDYLVRKKLSDMESQMPKQLFYKPHRSYIVNLRFVRSVDGKNILMKNGTQIPISRGKRNEFKSILMNYLRILR